MYSCEEKALSKAKTLIQKGLYPNLSRVLNYLKSIEIKGIPLLFHCLFNCNRAGDRGAYHRVVAHTDKAHHFNMSGN